MVSPPAELDVAERLGRSVFSSKSRRRARNGRIDVNIFLEREDTESVSVNRMDHAPLEELAGSAYERGRNRTPPLTFYGWEVVAVRDVARNGRTVVATPKPENRFHADIFPDVAGDERRRQQKQHANELAAHSQWLERPGSVA